MGSETTAADAALHADPCLLARPGRDLVWCFARDVLKDGVWHSKAELIAQIVTFIRSCTEQRAKPFRWTSTGRLLPA